MEAGYFKVIRTNGTETMHEGKPTFEEVKRLIGCDCLDTVTVSRTRSRMKMYVDDSGMIDEKPVNLKATALYHSVCRPGTVHQIHGDVVIVQEGIEA